MVTMPCASKTVAADSTETCRKHRIRFIPDVQLPWASVVVKDYGPPADPGFFPIAVWLQDPRNAGRYKRAGFNLYVGLWQGPTEAQLAVIESRRHAGHLRPKPRRSGSPRRPDHRRLDARRRTRQRPGNSRRENGPAPLWTAGRTGQGRRRLRAPATADPTRPVMLNLGQGVANDEWKGRGPGASLDDYPAYIRGADIVSFDVYPVADIDNPTEPTSCGMFPKVSIAC